MDIPAPTTFVSRAVERIVRGQAASDGDGVKLTRVLTQPLQKRLAPFLMLDAFGSDSANDYVGGFPDHPHRGFETVTIMLEGRMRHRDSVGNVGLLEPGSVQWMTAGRGIIHSEMPEQEEGRMAGFQLWVNLAAADKMTPPAYRDIAPAQVPAYTDAAGVRVRVIAGQSHGTAGEAAAPPCHAQRSKRRACIRRSGRPSPTSTPTSSTTCRRRRTRTRCSSSAWPATRTCVAPARRWPPPASPTTTSSTAATSAN